MQLLGTKQIFKITASVPLYCRWILNKLTDSFTVSLWLMLCHFQIFDAAPNTKGWRNQGPDPLLKLKTSHNPVRTAQIGSEGISPSSFLMRSCRKGGVISQIWRRLCLHQPPTADLCDVLLVAAVTAALRHSCSWGHCEVLLALREAQTLLLRRFQFTQSLQCVMDGKSLSTRWDPQGAYGAGDTLHMNCKV